MRIFVKYFCSLFFSLKKIFENNEYVKLDEKFINKNIILNMSQVSESSELFINCDEEVTAICKKLQQILTSIDIQEDKNFALKEA